VLIVTWKRTVCRRRRSVFVRWDVSTATTSRHHGQAAATPSVNMRLRSPTTHPLPASLGWSVVGRRRRCCNGPAASLGWSVVGRRRRCCNGPAASLSWSVVGRRRCNGPVRRYARLLRLHRSRFRPAVHLHFPSRLSAAISLHSETVYPEAVPRSSSSHQTAHPAVQV